MTEPGSVSLWINQLQEKDRDAIQKLWERYFRRMVALARERLQPGVKRGGDEEDIALSAFHSFCQGIERGRFPLLMDRDELWQLLLTITLRKAYKLVEHEGQQKRDWRRTRRTSDQLPAEADQPELITVMAKEPDPAFAVQVTEQCQSLLARLNDAELQQIALRKMEGYTNKEIAEQMDCAIPTIERRLRMIRKCWSVELNSD